MKALKCSVLARHYHTHQILCIFPSANTHHQRLADGTAFPYDRKLFSTSSPVKDWRWTHPWSIRCIGKVKNSEIKRFNEGLCYFQPHYLRADFGPRFPTNLGRNSFVLLIIKRHPSPVHRHHHLLATYYHLCLDIHIEPICVKIEFLCE